MAELTSAERLQPSLLDRLTDTDPGQKVESRERRVLSTQRLKAAVVRDLTWLLNTGHLETVEDLDDWPNVRSSVVNFGIPDLAGQVSAGIDIATLEKAVRKAITDFEPRIDKQSLKVTIRVHGDNMNRKSMTFEIEGDMWARPAPMPLFLKTAVDLETGNCTITGG